MQTADEAQNRRTISLAGRGADLPPTKADPRTPQWTYARARDRCHRQLESSVTASPVAVSVRAYEYELDRPVPECVIVPVPETSAPRETSSGKIDALYISSQRLRASGDPVEPVAGPVTQLLVGRMETRIEVTV